LIAAGLKPLGALSSQSRRKFSDDDCVAALRAAAEKLGEPPTVAAYGEFVRESEGRYPSEMTLRLRFGTWYEALVRAGLYNDPLGARASEAVEEAAGAFHGAAK
jgi:hypothetical protein